MKRKNPEFQESRKKKKKKQLQILKLEKLYNDENGHRDIHRGLDNVHHWSPLSFLNDHDDPQYVKPRMRVFQFQYVMTLLSQ